MNIQKTRRLSAEAKAKWIGWLSETPSAEIAVDLCEALQASSTSIAVSYLEVFSSTQQPLALGIVHTIFDLDLGPYLGGKAQQIFTGISTLGWRPLAMDVAFLELPFCNLPGLFMTPEGQALEPQVMSELMSFIRDEIKCDIFNLKTYDNRPCEKTLDGLGMVYSPFLANTSVELRFSSFEEYLSSLPGEWRENIRRNQRRFTAAGGKVTRLTDLESHAKAVADLFHSTISFHVSKGDMGRPLDIGEDLLKCLSRVSRNGMLFLAEVEGEVVGAMLALQSGSGLIAVKCGLIYEAAKPSRAYFNLYYAMIEYAILNQLTSLQLCAEAYDVKRRMGTVAPVSYYIDIRNRWIGPIIKLLAKHFSTQKGAAVSEAIA